MEPSFVIIFCAASVVACLSCYILGHRHGSKMIENLNRQQTEVLATTLFLLARGISILPGGDDDTDTPTDESDTQRPNLLLFKGGDEKKGDTVTPDTKE
jgi:hypothetical protein